MKKGFKIILDILGIFLIVGGLYFLYKLLGLFWGIAALIALVCTCFMNERHNPLVLYYKNYGKKKDE